MAAMISVLAKSWIAVVTWRLAFSVDPDADQCDDQIKLKKLKKVTGTAIDTG